MLLKNNSLSLFFLGALVLFLTSCGDDEQPDIFEEIVVSVNRASSSISFIDANTNEVAEELVIDGSEPMYAVYVRRNDMLYVGDRAQNAVLMIDPATRQVVGSIPVGSGVFHMWADAIGKSLWVNNDLDQTISVIDLSENEVVRTIDVGIKPHDVFVNHPGTRAYVSVFSGNPDTPDSIYMYDARSYERLGAQAVGKDPHTFHVQLKNQLFVPCQSGQLYVLSGRDLQVKEVIDLPGAHGVFSANRRDLYVTNITGAGLSEINTIKLEVTGSLTTPVNVPHNVVVDKFSKKLFVTHSGATANKVTVYDINGNNFSFEDEITVGTNPFGIAYYARIKRRSERSLPPEEAL